MRVYYYLIISLLSAYPVHSQVNHYEISFNNAIHHEAVVKARFTDLIADTLELRMSRSSPGRYALHEFAKNIYGFEARDGKGNMLPVFRPDPYSWLVSGHDGIVNISYLLYANRGDGTYSQIDETHAHLNMPATFMFSPALENRAIEVAFEPRADLNWKVATQLRPVTGNTYAAPNLQYFMDSPAELSDYSIREFQVNSGDKTPTIQFVLHHQGSEASFDAYFEQVKKVVLEEMAVYGELPSYDFNRYTFLACYMPQISGDGMEHRNSTILTDKDALEAGGMAGNIGTVSHEYFHSWNVERIRPVSLEPFNFERANMSGALWFAEGFTSYYTNLILCRAGIISPEEYVAGLNGNFNYVWNSPARKYFNPIEMSMQAPFVDAATSIDPVNRENTFISYYSYGSVLGLALDLSLRQRGLSLDGYMKLMWEHYGRNEHPYRVEELQEVLETYAGVDFGRQFFDAYIYKSGMPDYSGLFATVGLTLSRDPDAPFLGVSIRPMEDGSLILQGNTQQDTPAYAAGLENGDILLAINGESLLEGNTLGSILSSKHPGDFIDIIFKRLGAERSTTLQLGANPTYSIKLAEADGNMPSRKQMQERKAWLKQD
jgi:predicted metalloprotease with PDZ domain